MAGKTFMNKVASGREDILQILLGILHGAGAKYCVIGGLAVNAYVEPVVSLDLDLVVVAQDLQKLSRLAEAKGLKVERFEHRVNLSVAGSDLRVQVQTDPRYQEFIPRASQKDVLGYRMFVAAVEDVLQGKVWAFLDETRRRSKRQKDLADVMRLVESHPHLEAQLPPPVRVKLG